MAAHPAPAVAAPVFTGGRVTELDTLRAMAILAVMAYHEVSYPALHWLTVQGWVGVDLFFVLSGYLITGILLRSKAKPRYFQRFYGRRLLRIFPPYYAFLTLVLLTTLLLPGWQQPASVWAQYFLYLPSLLAPWSHAAQHMPVQLWMTLVICWSLSVEEVFYLIWAPAVRWLNRRSLLVLVGAMIIVAPVVRMAVHGPGHPEYFFFPARMDSLAWGALLALVIDQCNSLRAWLSALAVTGAATVTVFVVTRGNLDRTLFVTVGYSLLGVTFASLLATVLLLPQNQLVRRVMRNRATVWIGMTSYTTYLIHHPVQLILAAMVGHPGRHGALFNAALLMVSMGAAFGLSALSWTFFEQPILRVKEQLFGAGRVAAGTQGAS